MIFTVLLNPTLDKIIILPSFHSGGTFFCNNMETVPAGKAMSVSVALNTLKIPVTFLGLIGKTELQVYSTFLRKKNIPFHLISVEGKTRSNISIVDSVNLKSTHLRFPGFEINENHIRQITSNLATNVHKGDTVIFSGSAPKGTPYAFYTEINQILREKKANLVLDTSGETLDHILDLDLSFIKGNVEEFSRIFGHKINGLKEFDHFPSRTELEEIISQLERHDRSKKVLKIITLAQYGALAFNNEIGVHVFLDKPDFAPSYTIGCGDSFLAGLVAGLYREISKTEMLKLATACGAANTLSTGPGILKNSDIQALLPKVNIVNLKED